MNDTKETTVEFKTSEGVKSEGRLVRLGRFEVVFDVFGPENVLRTSEVLTQLKIVASGRVLYDGRATVSKQVTLPGGVTCQVGAGCRAGSAPRLAISGVTSPMFGLRGSPCG